VRAGPAGYVFGRLRHDLAGQSPLQWEQLKGTLEKTLKIYIRPALLLLDELGYLPIDRRGANLLFQVVAARYESGAIVLSTNRPLGDWGQTFDVDNTLATAMIDRLMHHGEPILIQGDSYRMKDKGNE